MSQQKTLNLSTARQHLVKKDPRLKALFKKHGSLDFSPRVERSPFESLVRAIAHQQLHGKAAETILGRFISLYSQGRFPTPTDILATADQKMRDCGFSKNKVKAIKDIAAKAVEGLIPDKKNIQKLSNEAIIDRLTQIYGVGKWTVEMLLIFQLGRLDVFPVDDFGVRNGYRLWKKKKLIPSAKDLKSVGAAWAPFQTVVSLYLWKEADSAKSKG
jgi:DNA-3-methyladenine glycosylase II